MSNTLYDNLRDVLEFVEENEGEFKADLCEVRRSPFGGLGVFAKQDIEPDTTLLKIPKSSIFSASNSSIANLLLDEEIDGILASIIAFIYETTVFKDGSHWYKYLETIKIKDSNGTLIVPPNHWNAAEKKLLKGSTLDTLHNGLIPEEEVKEGFNVAVSVARKWNEEFGLPIPAEFFDVDVPESENPYLRFVAVAYAISSRIFEIDAFHESALVPIADLFNHRVMEPDVHFSSLYEVCELCGEPGMCKHMIAETMSRAAASNDAGRLADSYNSAANDQSEDDGSDTSDIEITLTDDDGSSEHDNGSDSDDECVEMVLVNGINAGDEIFNSYGEYSNPLLLARYGFCVLENALDIVHLGREVLKLVKSDNSFKLRTTWWSDMGYALFDAWYSATRLADDEHGDDTPEFSKPWLSEMYVQFDGNASLKLHAFINLLSLNKKDWGMLKTAVECDGISDKHSWVILQRKPNHEHKKLFKQLLSMKNSSQASKDLIQNAASVNKIRIVCIRILLDNEREIIKRAKNKL